MEIIVASGLLTVVGLLLLARKVRYELTAFVKARVLLIAIFFAAAPIPQAFGAMAGERVVDQMFKLFGYAGAGAGWLLLIISLLGILAPTPRPSPGKSPADSGPLPFDNSDEDDVLTL